MDFAVHLRAEQGTTKSWLELAQPVGLWEHIFVDAYPTHLRLSTYDCMTEINVMNLLYTQSTLKLGQNIQN